jgi:peptidoglycan lytic transglycosylase
MRRLAIASALLLFLLPACGGKRTAPPSDADLAKLKPSQRPYTVLGKRYEPISSHEGFSQEGMASWYGPDFHGKKTSSGEVYDMYGMTAAHKTLPLGVYVKVRNKENGSEVIVKVNDRGPFVKNRVIDLSFTAAKKLGVDVRGTAPVRVEALGYRAAGTGGEVYFSEPDSYDSGSYAVQVGSFRDAQNAERLSGEMRKLFGHAEIQQATVNGERFSRVLVGKYTSLRAAEEAERKFAEHGYPGSFTVSLE